MEKRNSLRTARLLSFSVLKVGKGSSEYHCQPSEFTTRRIRGELLFVMKWRGSTGLDSPLRVLRNWSSSWTAPVLSNKVCAVVCELGFSVSSKTIGTYHFLNSLLRGFQIRRLEGSKALAESFNTVEVIVQPDHLGSVPLLAPYFQPLRGYKSVPLSDCILLVFYKVEQLHSLVNLRYTRINVYASLVYAFPTAKPRYASTYYQPEPSGSRFA